MDYDFYKRLKALAIATKINIVNTNLSEKIKDHHITDKLIFIQKNPISSNDNLTFTILKPRN